MNVPLLDLKIQYKALKTELDNALLKVAESQYFILGKEVDDFEKEIANYIGCKYAYGVSSGTDALLLALMALGIQPDDEIIVPTYSFFATAGVVARLNAKPILVDSDPVTFNINPSLIEKKITSKTKAIIPVHLYGQSVAMDEIVSIAKKYNLKIVEDAAQAIGVKYKDGRSVGTIGDVGCFSFFPSKNLGCFGDAGLVTTNDEKIAEQLQIMRVHGGKPKYYHKVIGGNFRIDAIQAAVLRVKLPHLDSWCEGRRTNAELYNQLFISHKLASETGKINYSETEKVLLPKAVYKSSSIKNYHIFNQYIIRVEKRDELRKFLSENNIASEIYYPVPFHRQECFKYLNTNDSDFPVANNSAEHSIALPIYPELTKEHISYVVETINKFFN
ncbi:MAG: DegT/DnrJ/EryC1/StrS family aminotransferase [Ignavibacteria bacterium]|nr:DegT/DnrJ/EryC1/StrS family aminotransferase [Ignavibacteria bacterium]